jgi:hypothetical protein
VDVRIFKIIGDSRSTDFDAALRGIASLDPIDWEQQVDTGVTMRLGR